jgi:hypothetical protein
MTGAAPIGVVNLSRGIATEKRKQVNTLRGRQREKRHARSSKNHAKPAVARVRPRQVQANVVAAAVTRRLTDNVTATVIHRL